MGYANYVGRVGGLAVALGVGMAVASTGTAYADSTDAGSQATDTSPRGSAKAARAAHANPNAATRNANAAPPAAAARANDSSPTQAPRAAASRSPFRAPAPVVAADNGVSTPAAVTNTVPAAAPAVVADIPAPLAARTADTSSTAAPVVVSASAPPAAAATAAAVAHPLLGAPATRQFIKSLLTQLIGSGPLGGQTQNPALWALLSFVRKEFGKNSAASVTANASATASSNLLFNPGAEIGDLSPSGMTAATIPGWELTGTPTVIGYGGPRTIWSVGTASPMPNLPARIGFPLPKVGPNVNGTFTGGNQFFGGGMVADATISQMVDLSTVSAAIDSPGGLGYNLGAWLGGYTLDPSAASVKVTFLDGSGKSLGTAKLKEVGLFQRLFATKFIEQTTKGVLPTGTRAANVEVVFTDKNPIKYGLNAKYNDAFADNISFTVDTALSAPTALPPVVNPTMVGSLDHVFMTYVENKGYNNIVGSDLAPFLNSLINDAEAGKTANFATNYYAMTHGSLPNYYPIVGGTNYGITYNCATVCINDTTNNYRTLLKSLNASSKDWKDYAEGLQVGQDTTVSGGDYAFDSSPFQAFQSVGGNKAYSNAHIVVTTELPFDLKSGATTPAFVWLGADENSNGEGPVSGISGKVKFLLNQLNPKHPYNIPALDQFLQDNYTTITSSDMWKGPDKSAIFITFDEDNNNTNLGFSHEGNHIVTLVVPNQAAIDAGMKVGVVSDNHYDHYSLVRTVEESLGLVGNYGYLTNNDKWATPMNDLWS